MSFSYSGDPSTSDLDEVRTLLADTDSTDVLLTDETITWLLTEWPTTYQAARAGAEIIASQMARDAISQKRIGDLSLSYDYSARANDYRKLAESLAAQAARKTAPRVYANPDALLSTRDREAGTTTDFRLGQFDDPPVDDVVDAS